jgi:hypothetical protein
MMRLLSIRALTARVSAAAEKNRAIAGTGRIARLYSSNNANSASAV